MFASGPDAEIEAAAEIMNRQLAADVEQLTGDELQLPSTANQSRSPAQSPALRAAVYMRVV